MHAAIPALHLHSVTVVPSMTEDLLRTSQQLRETHISWVFLHEDRVYKVKRPVDLGFVDFTSIEKRKAACDAEVALNRRFSPDAYLGVVPVTLDGDGAHHIDGSGEVVDWAVCMKRLPDEARVDSLLAAGSLGERAVDAIADHVAKMHGEARSDAATAAYGAAEQIEDNVRGNLGDRRPAVHAYLSEQEERLLLDRQLAFVEQHRGLFEERRKAGKVVEGHGDLKAEHFYVDGSSVTVLDCAEFSERFRCSDVASDLAFLSMELRVNGRADLAERLLARYALVTSDYDLYRLVDFYEEYRATVRASVAAILAEDESAPEEFRKKARKDATQYFRFLLRRPAPSRERLLLAVGGMIASGKSTISSRVSSLIDAPMVSSDRIRKSLVGVDAMTPLVEQPFLGVYGAEFSARVYDEVLRCARTVLECGRSVIVDASFRVRHHRDLARRLASDLGARFHMLECRVSEELTRERLRLRRRHPGVSDGRVELYDEFVARWEPMSELPPAEHHVIDTSSPVDDNVGEIRKAVQAVLEA